MFVLFKFVILNVFVHLSFCFFLKNKKKTDLCGVFYKLDQNPIFVNSSTAPCFHQLCSYSILFIYLFIFKETDEDRVGKVIRFYQEKRCIWTKRKNTY